MPRMTAAERYAARKTRTAVDLRQRTLLVAQVGARHARLRDRYGDSWRRILADLHPTQLRRWDEIVERNEILTPDREQYYLNSPWREGRLRASVNRQPLDRESIADANPYRNPSDPEFGRYLYRRPRNPGRGVV